MILSRFWYGLLALLVVLAFAAASAAGVFFDQEAERHTRRSLERDVSELEHLLRIDARQRLDALAPFAANGELRRALRTASAREGRVPRAQRRALIATLRELNGQLGEMRGHLLFAVDRDGYIVAHLGPGPVPEGAGLGAFPLVERALAGYLRDDMWVLDDRVYRMVARPVIEGGQYVGALLHGMALDEELAQRLSRGLGGATVSFFRGEEILAGHRPPEVGGAPSVNDPAGYLAEVASDPRIRQGGFSAPRDLPGANGMVVYSLVRGSARHARVGYAVSRPRPRFSSSLAMIGSIPAEAWGGAPFAVLVPFGLVLFGVAMVLVFLERDRPLRRLAGGVAGVAKGSMPHLDLAPFPGLYRTIARSVNEAVARLSPRPSTADEGANLDAILGPEDAGAPSFYAFADGRSAPPDAPLPSSVPPSDAPGGAAASTPADSAPPVALPGVEPDAAPPPGPAAASPSTPGPPAPGGPPPAPPGRRPLSGPPRAPSGRPPQGPSSRPPSSDAPSSTSSARPSTGFSGPRPGSDAPPAPLGAPPPPPRPPPPGPPPPGSVPSPRPSAPAASGLVPPPGEEPVEAPPTIQPGDLKRTLVGVAPPESKSDDEDEGQTMVAQVPRELLARAGGDEASREDEAHFREVFQKFVETKQECGESTSQLTYDKFAVTLRKNRDKIVQKHGAKTVRFTVYVKEGKAALKATPIRE
ncbi:MAG: MXAN_5187 C-terminal domain-containing protein [Sandaracinaceae bacterium]